MTAADDAILEFLYNDGDSIVATPVVIAANIDYTKNYVAKRVKPLRESGLIEYTNERSGMYGITSRGEMYLSGKISADELED